MEEKNLYLLPHGMSAAGYNQRRTRWKKVEEIHKEEPKYRKKGGQPDKSSNNRCVMAATFRWYQ